MSKPIYIFHISSNYTRCVVYVGSRWVKNLLGTSTLVPEKGMAREQRYNVIARWLHEQFDIFPPSYQSVADRRRWRKAIKAASAK